MEHIKWDLGTVKKGSVVVVRLRNQANVLLMDSNNYRAYARGAGARYYGGLAKTSPVQLAVPGDGHWFVAIDLGGASGRIDAGVVVQPPPRGSLPPIRQGGSLNVIRHGVPEAPPSPNVLGGRTWDVFISHASEDKESVARPLATTLEALGVSVWLDEIELKIGDSLRRMIDQGIRSSKFAAVIFSASFFAKRMDPIRARRNYYDDRRWRAERTANMAQRDQG